MIISNSTPERLLTMRTSQGSFCIPNHAKRPLTIDEMISLFRKRKLNIQDEQSFRCFPRDNNYYRLSAYFRFFQIDPGKGINDFRPNTTENSFAKPYMNDVHFRALLFRICQECEILIRSRFAYIVANRGGAYSYTNPLQYFSPEIADNKGSKQADDITTRLTDQIKKWLENSSEPSIRHFRKNSVPTPIWAAVEVLPFGIISQMMSVWRDEETIREVYKSLGLTGATRTSSEIIHSIVYLRNLCAHGGRLWYRNTTISAPMIKKIMKQSPLRHCQPRSVAAIIIPLLYIAQNLENGEWAEDEVHAFLGQDKEYRRGIMEPRF